MAVVRPLAEADIGAVIELYRAAYGDSFPFPEFYDAAWIKKGVFDDDIDWLVAQRDSGEIVGTAAVMTDVGDADDLIGEFGRLVVHPDARGEGIGAALFGALVAAHEPTIDFGFAECRTAHIGAQKIADRAGFKIVGIEPLAYSLLGGRESMVFVVRLFGLARELRRNNPRVIPEVFQVGSMALRNCGFEPDLIPLETVSPYPSLGDNEATLDVLDPLQVARALRLSRAHVDDPEVFGGMRLEYGFLKLKTHHAQHLVLLRAGAVVGALGYVCDDIDHKVRVFELLAADEAAKGALLTRGLAHLETVHDPAYVQIDVSAYSTRMQRTLSLLGFAPVAYCPSMVYSAGERLDVVKMVKLRLPVKLHGLHLSDPAAEMLAVVKELLIEKARGVTVDAIARQVELFRGLTDMQLGLVRAVSRELPYQAGEVVFERDSDDQALFVVLEGEVDIEFGGSAAPLASIGPGEIFGELALIDELPRSAGAVCRKESRLLVIRPSDFQQLLAQGPRLGVVILRNIVSTVATRLRRTTARLEAVLTEPDASGGDNDTTL